MLEIPEISSLERNLLFLGFKSKRDYAKSELYNLVRSQILHRDDFKCRKIGCTNRASKIQYVQVDVASLAGFPFLLFSLCDDCSKASFIVSPPHSEALTLHKVFNMVSGLRKTKNQNSPTIGKWYREQFTDPKNKEAVEVIGKCIPLLPGRMRKVKEFWSEKKKEQEKMERKRNLPSKSRSASEFGYVELSTIPGIDSVGNNS